MYHPNKEYNKMINATHVFKAGTQLLNKNSPAILTAFGAVGVVGTAVLTGKASFEAAKVIADAQFKQNMDKGVNTPLTRPEKIKLVWPLYISAVSSGTLSCGAIVMSHRISSRRAAMLAAAYALNEGKLEEYQEKVKEKFGAKKADEVKNEVHQDRINKTYDEGSVVFSPLDGKVLIREDYTGRFFWSSRDAVEKAVNEVNHEILREGSVRLSEFYDSLGLEHVSVSDHFGFNQNEMLELSWDVGTTPDGNVPVHTFDYVNPPVMNPSSNPFR